MQGRVVMSFMFIFGLIFVVSNFFFAMISSAEILGYHIFNAGTYILLYSLILGISAIMWAILANIPITITSSDKPSVTITKRISMVIAEMKNPNYVVSVWTYYLMVVPILIINIVLLSIFTISHGFHASVDLDIVTATRVTYRWFGVNFYLVATSLLLAFWGTVCLYWFCSILFTRYERVTISVSSNVKGFGIKTESVSVIVPALLVN